MMIYTPPKFNIAPEKLPSQRESSLPTIIFRGELLNFGRVSGRIHGTNGILYLHSIHKNQPCMDRQRATVRPMDLSWVSGHFWNQLWISPSSKQKAPFGCSKNNGTPKWMVKIMKNPMNKWMIWEPTPIFGNIHL